MTQESRLVVTIDSKNAERNARNLAIELESIEKKGDFATKSMDSMSVATRQLAGYMAGLVTVGAAVSKIDAWTGLQNRLKLVTNSQIELNKAMSDTFEIAQKTRQSWDAAAQVYQGFANNAKTLGLNMQETARLTETVSKAVAISGASAASAEAALVQFNQALASGTLRGEELNSVMEQTPGLARAIAQGMGITIGQLRSVAAEGKITSEVLVKALNNSQQAVDDLFAKTDATIGQSLTMLSNELTKFVGEAGKSSGAANALSGSIQILANNLELIADGAIVAGIGYLGTAIAAKSAIVQKDIAVTLGSIAASREKALAEAAEAAAQVRLTQAQVINTQSTLAAIAAEKALEVERLKAQINAVGRTKSLTRMAELKKIEAQATRELAAAETALAAAQARSAAAQTASVGMMGAMAGAGRTLLGVLGGPVGIGLTVASLVATYLLFRDNGEEANKMLERQAKYAGVTAEEFRKLNKLKQESLTDQAQKDLADYNKELDVNANQFNAVVRQMIAYAQQHSASAQTIAELREVERGLREETLSLDEAMKILSKNEGLPKNLKDKVLEAAEAYFKTEQNVFKAEKIVKTFGGTAVVTGNNAQTLASRTRELGNEAEGASGKIKTLDDKVKELNKSLADRAWDAAFKRTLIDKYGMSIEQAEDRLKVYRENEKKGVVGITLAQKELFKVIDAEESKLQGIVDKRKEATKELAKQQKILQVNSKVQSNAAKYNFSGLENKYGLPTGTLSSIHMIESKGNVNAYNKTTGASGGFQFLKGTADQYGVKNRNDLAQSAEGAAKYMSYLLKLFKGDLEKAVRAYHAGEGNVQKGKNIGKYNNQYWKDFQGYMAGMNGYSSGDLSSKEWERMLEDAAKMAEQQAELRKNLELSVASEVTKVRSKLADDLEQIDKAGFSPERTATLKAEYQARADNDIAIAEYALRTKLDDYKDFQKSEEELLKDSFDQRKFYAARDIELTKQQRDEAVKLLEKQYQQEAGLLELARRKRLFQAEQFMMGEMERIQRRYQLEREEIMKTANLDVEERRRRFDAATYSQKREEDDLFLQTSLSYNQAIGINTSPDEAMMSRQTAIDNMYQSGFIKQQEYEKQSLASMQQYERDKQNLALGSLDALLAATSSTWSGMTQLVRENAGEQSGAYKAMFLMQQAFALSSATINALMAYNQVLASPWTFDPISKQTAATITLAMGMANVGMIAGQTLAGFSSGGYTGPGGKYDIAGTVHKGEVVFSQEDVARWGGPSNVESLRKSSQREFKQTELVQGAKNTASSPNIIINLPEGTEVNTSKAADGTITIDVVRKEAAAAARQSWVNLNNSNSFESKQIQRNTTAEVKR
ncbi:tape measure protein [Acinetobacter radioresistens]|uniref:tape measure protein n=1 Tax=Acinetobacter radioresistens TaxID=40216 RepID=UPI002030F0D8|nr:tape measure protein [Acinetobacter radioresistens]MCM1934634.1 tape measure protein [Acinetobacter radioresistens]MCM1952079.1 tape measure protein [Acinetobacter radioresistens]